MKITNRRFICSFIFVLTVLVRLAIVLALGLHKQSDYAEVPNIAESLVNLGVFGNPFSLPTGPTAHLSPGYPFLLSYILRVFGTGPESQLIRFMIDSSIVAVSYCLLPIVSDALGMGLLSGAIAGILAATFPVHILSEIWGGDCIFTTLFMILLTLSTMDTWSRCRFDLSTALRTGFLSGVALLFSANLLFVIISFIGMSLVLYKQHWRKIGLYAAVVTITSLVILSPWAIRNYFVLGAPIFLRDNFGLELQVSNNDLAKANAYDNRRSAHLTYHPTSSHKEAHAVAQLGEITYMQRKLTTAMEWIWNNPGRFVHLTAQRLVLFWFPITTRPLQSFLLWVLTICAIVAICLLYQRIKPAALLIAAIWFSYPFVYYLVQADTRYRYPIHWTFLLLFSWLAILVSHNFRQKLRLWSPALAFCSTAGKTKDSRIS